MKKVLLGVSAIVLAACNNQSTPEVQTQEQAMGEYEQMANLVATGKPVRCLMTDTEKGHTMTYLMKDKKVKMTDMMMSDTGETGAMLMDTEYMYTWSDQKKEGTKMKLNLEDLKESADQAQQDVPDLSNEEDRKAYEEMGYTINCEEAQVSDSEFVPPTDVKFMDMSAMMEKAKEAQQGMTPEQQKQMEEMMKQYAQ